MYWLVKDMMEQNVVKRSHIKLEFSEYDESNATIKKSNLRYSVRAI